MINLISLFLRGGVGGVQGGWERGKFLYCFERATDVRCACLVNFAYLAKRFPYVPLLVTRELGARYHVFPVKWHAFPHDSRTHFLCVRFPVRLSRPSPCVLACIPGAFPPAYPSVPREYFSLIYCRLLPCFFPVNVFLIWRLTVRFLGGLAVNPLLSW